MAIIGAPNDKGLQSLAEIAAAMRAGNSLLARELADAILAHLAREAETLDMVVFCQDVDAIPRKRFV